MVLQQHPQRCSDVTLGSPARKGSATIRPQNTGRKTGLRASPGALGRTLGSRLLG